MALRYGMAALALSLVTVALLLVARGGDRAATLAPPSGEGREWLAQPTPAPLRGWALTDDGGRPFAEDAFVGGWTVVVVGYTSCPDVCPMALTRLGEALAAEPALRGVFLAVDPARDQPRLAGYVRFFHPRLRGISGATAAVDLAVGALGASYRLRADGTVEHSTAFFVVDPQANLAGVVLHPGSGTALRVALAELKARWRPGLEAALWSPAAPEGVGRVAYGRMLNPSDVTVVVDGDGRGGGEVSLHETVTRDGMAQMRALPRLALPPGEAIELAPGARHLMVSERAAGRGVIELGTVDGRRYLVALRPVAEAAGIGGAVSGANGSP